MQTDNLSALRGRIKLPIRMTITTVFALFTAISISLVASLSFFSGRDIILASAKDDIAKAAETAQKTIDGLVGQASLTAETIAGMAPEMFEWRTPEALAQLGERAAEVPDDPVVALLSEKCRGYIAEPPPASWNGATQLDKK